ncbi:cupin domain-containing protein [Enterococcus sp. DIV1314a]|uniref:cupin domain-containing protein n=1 Tax=Enterococcus sp. DIV1314a TaxID=2774660 RepID=UPI003F683FA3
MEEAGMIQRLFKMSEIAQFDHKQGKKNLFYETDQTAGAVWCLEPGQEIPTHAHAKADDLWICIQGTGTFYPAQGEEIEITVGDLILSRPGEQHGMKNTGQERFICVGVATPLPLDFIPK